MESQTEPNTECTLYQKISNTWNIIFDFLDIESLFKVEGISKYFKNQLFQYYESKESLIKINKVKTNENDKNNHIKLFKKELLSNYLNLFVHINISENKFCNQNEKIELTKKSYPGMESVLIKNRMPIEQISIQDNTFLILYKNNIFSILEFDMLNTHKKFDHVFSYDFENNIISNFTYYENQNEKIIFFIKENSSEFFYLNIKERNVQNFDLKKTFEIFQEDNLVITRIFTFNDFLLFLTNKEEFILVPNKELKIFKNTKEKKDKKDKKDSDEDKKSEDNSSDENASDDKKQDNIVYPKKLEKTYGAIKHIYSNNSNVIILNNDYQIFSIPSSDYKNYSTNIPKFKLFTDQKFPNFYTIGGYSNYFLLLEIEKLMKLEK